MYTTAFHPIVCTDLDKQHLIGLFLIAGDDVTSYVASPAKQAYANLHGYSRASFISVTLLSI